MPRYRVTIAPEAVIEVVQIATWWRAHRRAAPNLFRTELDDALALIGDYPEAGTRARSRRVGNARVFSLRRSGYRVFYQVSAREVLVVHVRHAKRRSLKLE